MGTTDLTMHYVCTLERAGDLIKAHDQFWVCNCGCRESGQGCARSRMEVCLMFDPNDPGSGSGKKEVGLAGVMEILREAQIKHLVVRPFRNQDRTETDGICFCCDDCCGYFLDPSEACDKGELVAATDWGVCSHCGACVDVCYFKARKMDGDELKVDEERCYGCGLCVDVCLENSIQMVRRI